MPAGARQAESSESEYSESFASELSQDEGGSSGSWDEEELTDDESGIESESDEIPVYEEIDAVYESDSSTEDVTNTVGKMSMDAYKDFPHIGYDIDGKRIYKPATRDELDSFLEKFDNDGNSMAVMDRLQQKMVTLSAEELEIIRRLESGLLPDEHYNPYEPAMEWFTSKTEIHPLINIPEPKRRFVPSKWEGIKIMKIVRAIRSGKIVARPETKEQEPKLYDLWESENVSKGYKPRTMNIIAPKIPLPRNQESYNPPDSVLPSKEEIEKWEQQDPSERRPKYLPTRYDALRHVPLLREPVARAI